MQASLGGIAFGIWYGLMKGKLGVGGKLFIWDSRPSYRACRNTFGTKHSTAECISIVQSSIVFGTRQRDYGGKGMSA